MQAKIRERRLHMLKVYGQSFSVKEAVELTARKFGCKESVLYVDWSRRGRWLDDLCSFKDSEILIRRLIMDILQELKKIEELRVKNKNDNVRLGAVKLATNIRFKLIDLFRDFDDGRLKGRTAPTGKLVLQGARQTSEDGKNLIILKMWRPDDEEKQPEIES